MLFKTLEGSRSVSHTLRAVHAHRRVVIDCRVAQQSVIGIVRTMGTKESISYKMISHGPWCRERDRGGGIEGRKE